MAELMEVHQGQQMTPTSDNDARIRLDGLPALYVSAKQALEPNQGEATFTEPLNEFLTANGLAPSVVSQSNSLQVSAFNADSRMFSTLLTLLFGHALSKREAAHRRDQLAL